MKIANKHKIKGVKKTKVHSKDNMKEQEEGRFILLVIKTNR